MIGKWLGCIQPAFASELSNNSEREASLQGFNHSAIRLASRCPVHPMICNFMICLLCILWSSLNSLRLLLRSGRFELGTLTGRPLRLLAALIPLPI